MLRGLAAAPIDEGVDAGIRFANFGCACTAMEVGAVSAPTEAKPGGIKLRPAEFRDYEQIVLLESRHGLGSRTYTSWERLWSGNPAYRDLRRDWIIGWVGEDQDHRIVASLASIPLWYEFKGRRILAGTGKGLVAEPAYRSSSLLLLNRLINQTPVDLYLNNTVGESSLPLVELFECQRVPVGAWDRAGFWITQYKPVFESLFALRKVRQPRLLSYPAAAVAYLRDAARERVRSGDTNVVECRRFDERFDTFWESLKARNPDLLLAVRTREVLEWHFEHAVLENRLWIGGITDGARLAAYAIFERKDTGGIYSGLKRVRLVDFQSLHGADVLLRPLLGWALKRCRNEGIHLLEVVGSWLEKGDVVDTLVPYRRELPAWTYFYRAKDAEMAGSLRERRAWAPSLFDGDATL